MAHPPTLKVQTWGDDLRLPCFVNPAETAGLLTELEPLRQIPFQSKHVPSLKRNTWFVLKRTAENLRSGLVVLWPAMKCCVYISGDPISQKRPVKRVALLRIRVDPQFLSEDAGLTVFSATLSSSARRLVIDDALIWKGRRVLDDEPFSKRWNLALQWVEHYCIMDPRLMSDIEIEMARWSPLDRLRPELSWELQPDEAGAGKRLLWIANHEDAVTPLSSSLESPIGAPTLDVGPLVAGAQRDAGPEQWILSAGDGSTLGKALIRTLDVSVQMRSVKGATARVEVAWNPTFTKWEIKALTSSLVSHAANFEAAK